MGSKFNDGLIKRAKSTWNAERDASLIPQLLVKVERTVCYLFGDEKENKKLKEGNKKENLPTFRKSFYLPLKKHVYWCRL